MSKRVLKRNVYDFVKFLQKSAKRHKQGWHHYTSMSSLVRMSNARSVCFSLISESNDGSEFKTDRHYMMSFSYASEESIALWSVYGVPKKDAIRIKFPMRNINAWIDSVGNGDIEMFGIEAGRKSQDLSNIESRVFISDVAYYADNGLVVHKGKKYSLKKDDDFDAMFVKSPFAKKWPWSYEQEMRIIIEFKEPVLNAKGNPYKRIAVDFADPMDSLLSGEGEIMLGPWCTRAPSTVQSRGLSRAQIKASGFTRLLKLRQECDCCKKRCNKRGCQDRKK